MIAHSMGVGFARVIAKGGIITAAKNPINIGPPLTDKIDTFVSLAAGAYGMDMCFEDELLSPCCNSLDGYYPGTGDDSKGLAQFLQMLNDDETREG